MNAHRRTFPGAMGGPKPRGQNRGAADLKPGCSLLTYAAARSLIPTWWTRFSPH